ncbi:MAG: hypothetical protein AAGE59_05440 [Cyanobacteria bacterium P01_F01_bin.86]
MPLSPGTALQNGQYTVDALLETASNGDLYWGTHIVTGTRIYIQSSPLSTSINPSDLSALMAHLQGTSLAAQFPFPKPFQLFHGESKDLYLAMGLTIGRPWTQAYRTYAPMSWAKATKIVRDVANGTLWLSERGIKGIDLSLNRIWVAADGTHITLTGLPHKYLSCKQDHDSVVDATLRSLVRLLYCLLSGELPPSSDLDLEQAFRERLPQLPSSVIQVVQTGTDSSSLMLREAIEKWLSMLPETAFPETTSPSPHPSTAQSIASPQPAPVSHLRRWSLYPALGGTALLAAVGGITLGTAWRLNAQGLSNDIQFDPNQSFPSRSDWLGDKPEAAFEAPYVPGIENPDVSDEWIEPAWEESEPQPEWVPYSEEPPQTLQNTEIPEEETEAGPAPWASTESVKQSSTDKTIAEEETVPETVLEMLVPPSSDDEEVSSVHDATESEPIVLPEPEWVPAPAPAPTSES